LFFGDMKKCHMNKSLKPWEFQFQP